MLMSITKRHNQRGIGLLELMLSLAIISVMLLMATRYYKSADQGQKVSNAISMITGIAGAGAQYLNTHPAKKATDLDLKVLTDDGFLSKEFSTMNNPWGGTIKVSGGDSGLVTITMDKVPGGPCRILQSSFSDTTGSQCGTGDATGTIVVNY